MLRRPLGTAKSGVISMSRKRLRTGVFGGGFPRRALIVLALAALLLGIARVGGRASGNNAGARTSFGMVRAANTDAAASAATASTSTTAASFGPNVGNGHFDGSSI